MLPGFLRKIGPLAKTLCASPQHSSTGVAIVHSPSLMSVRCPTRWEITPRADAVILFLRAQAKARPCSSPRREGTQARFLTTRRRATMDGAAPNRVAALTRGQHSAPDFQSVQRVDSKSGTRKSVWFDPAIGTIPKFTGDLE